MPHTMKNRAGFTLVEVMIALTLTAVLGAAVMGAFVSQSRFFDHQEKVGAARAVSRGAMNIMMSEMRLVERSGGVVSAGSNAITLRVPYVFGMSCGTNANLLTITTLPADLTGMQDATGVPIPSFAGYAYRLAGGSYVYQEGAVSATTTTVATVCTSAGLVPNDGGIVPDGDDADVLPDGNIIEMTVATSVPVGAPIFLYHRIRYEFAASTSVPGRVALWREVEGAPSPEELIAPFDTTAEFRYFANDAATATTVPATLSDITGIEIVLDAVSERPNGDGTFQSVPLTTAVHFRNR